MNSNLFQNGTNNFTINIIPQVTDTYLPPIKQYWCYMCKKSFCHIEENSDIQCPFCNKTFCEILTNEDTSDPSHPKNFEPFILNNNQTNSNTNENNNSNANDNSNSNSGNILNVRHIRSNVDTLNRQIRLNDRLTRIYVMLDYLNRYIMEMNMNNFQNYNNYLDNIFNQLMINDTNNYGNPPAAKNEIKKLKKFKINADKLKEFGIENTCAVCKDEFKIGEDCLLMPCNHHFHENCIMPWLSKRNSCPVCRYELPTDDKDFEEMKKLKTNRVNNNANNINNENS